MHISRKKLYQHIKLYYSQHPFLRAVSRFALITGAILSSISLYSYGINYYRNTIGWKGVEQAKIDKLAPTTSVDYVTSVLGQPILSKQLNETETGTIYKSRGYWVQAISISADKSIKSLSITACDDFHPKVKNNPVGNTITIGKTRLDRVATNIYGAGKNDYKIEHPLPNSYHYHISGATAASYFFDEYYYGNPSRYQTVFAGVSEVCGDLFGISKSDFDFIDGLYGKTKLTDSEIKKLSGLRSRLTVNTVTILAPMADSQAAVNNLYFMGVEDDIYRTFQTNEITEELIKSLEQKNRRSI